MAALVFKIGERGPSLVVRACFSKQRGTLMRRPRGSHPGTERARCAACAVRNAAATRRPPMISPLAARPAYVCPGALAMKTMSKPLADRFKTWVMSHPQHRRTVLRAAQVRSGTATLASHTLARATPVRGKCGSAQRHTSNRRVSHSSSLSLHTALRSG